MTQALDAQKSFRILCRIVPSATVCHKWKVGSNVVFQYPLPDRSLCYVINTPTSTDVTAIFQDPLPDRSLCYIELVGYFESILLKLSVSSAGSFPLLRQQ